MKKEDLFSMFGELNIFKYYIGEIKLSRLMISPLRKETNPSFNIFRNNKNGDKYLFKDFGTGDTGNCIRFVQLLYNLNYNEAIQKIYSDLSGNPNNLSVLLCLKAINNFDEWENTSNHTITPISYNIIEWNDITYEYWKQYGITIETLNFYNVKPITNLFINNNYVCKYTRNEPMYTYTFYYKNNIYSKVYRPKSKNKWFSNTNKKIIEGYDQMLLKKQKDVLIITKSLKDVMVLKEMGYCGVSPQSENTDLNMGAIPNHSTYYLLFDNDVAGRKASDSFIERYKDKNIQQIFLEEAKDISDLVVLRGFDYAKQLLCDLIKVN